MDSDPIAAICSLFVPLHGKVKILFYASSELVAETEIDHCPCVILVNCSVV